MIKVCTEQLEGSDAWVDNFIPQEESNLELEDVAKPQLLAFEGVPDYLAAASLLLNVNGMLNNYNSHYYYFNLGISIGSFFGGSFANFDKWLELGIIDETSVWERYTA